MENIFKDFFVFSFITPSQLKKISYKVQKHNLWLALQKHSWFEKGEIFNTVEKGVIYPIIHRVHLNNDKVILMEPTELGEEYYLQQGLYTEIHYFQPPNFASIDGRSDDDKAYVFLGFMSLDTTFNDILEDSWKEWTGARLIYLNLSSDFGISRVSFYRRVNPPDIDMFMYILLIECTNVNSKNIFQLLNFIQKVRVERVFGYLSAYKIESTLLTSSLIKGMLMETDDQNTKVDI